MLRGGPPLTRLSPSKPLRRETDVLVRRVIPLVVELFPRYMCIREKGAKTGYNLDYQAAYDLARKIAARKEGKHV
jgi:hypothetical protein